MDWHERFKTEIKIGGKYLTRGGSEVIVTESYPNGEFKYEGRVDRIVNKFGGFGTYPNSNDIVKELRDNIN